MSDNRWRTSAANNFRHRMINLSRKLARTCLGAAMGAALLATPALADEHWHGGDWHGGPGWHGAPGWHGDIARFHDHDFAVWRGGHWFHGWHGGRAGWWWLAGDGWWYYPAPVAGIPDPYIPPVVSAAPQGNWWYYCANPQGYYPYIPECSTSWQAVPPSPAAPPAPAPGPAAPPG